jgi:hypothetical protein
MSTIEPPDAAHRELLLTERNLYRAGLQALLESNRRAEELATAVREAIWIKADLMVALIRVRDHARAAGVRGLPDFVEPTTRPPESWNGGNELERDHELDRTE